MKKENQRVVVSKRMLKEGVLRLLEDKQIRNISISELCEEASINRTTFYRHYQTADDVLKDIESDFMNQLHNEPVPVKNTKDIHANVFRICQFFYDNKEMAMLFIKNDIDNHFRMLFQSCADEYIAARKIRYKGKSVNTNTLQLLTAYCTHGVYSMVFTWLTEEIPMSPHDVADLIVGSFNRDFSFS